MTHAEHHGERRRALTATLLVALVALVACGDSSSHAHDAGPGDERGGTPSADDASRASAPFAFHDVAAQSGLDVVTWCGRPEKPHLLESGGTGLALLDHDLDGDLDLYVVNGWRLDGSTVVERGLDRLYRNRGDGTFDDVTASSGMHHDGWGCGVTVGDVDADGYPDLFVTNFGADTLSRNAHDGSFREVADAPGIDGWSTGAALFDADGDGDDDLFVSGYIDCTLDEVLSAQPTLDWHGQKVMYGPFGMTGLANRFFVNDGELRFRESTAEAGLEDVGQFFSFAVLAADLDGDLDTDLYVANDSNPNYLYRNDGEGRFAEMGLWSGAATDKSGMAQAGMGLAAGDLDDDGLLDLFVTNFEQDGCTLYGNAGDCLFDDISLAARLTGATYSPLSWGAALSDLDLDGDLDLFVANGHIYPQADEVRLDGRGYGQPDLLLANDGGRFTDVTAEAGSGLALAASSRGLGVGDLDGDGDLDLVVSHVDAPPSLLRNDTTPKGAWLLVDAPDAVRVSARIGGRTWVRHRQRGGSYVSANDQRLHFGLGDAARVDLLTLTWVDGSTTELRDVPARQVVSVARER